MDKNTQATLQPQAPPRVSFSRYSQTKAPRVKFSEDASGAGVAGSSGRRHVLEDQSSPGGAVSAVDAGAKAPPTHAPLSPLQPINSSGGPISSVSKANQRTYSYPTGDGKIYSKDNGNTIVNASWNTSRNFRKAIPTFGPQKFHGGSKGGVYDFSQRVILTQFSRPWTEPDEYADAPNQDYIYETALGQSNSPDRLVNGYNNCTMQGYKSKRGRVVSKAPSPAATPVSPQLQSEPGGAATGGQGSGGNPGEDSLSVGSGPSRYRTRRPVYTKVVQVGPKNLPFAPGGTAPHKNPLARGLPGFFPPVKLRDTSFFAQDLKRRRNEMRTPPFVLELAPEEAALFGAGGDLTSSGVSLRAPSAKSSITKSDPSLNSSCGHGRQYALSMTPPVYPHVASDTSCDDLTTMPPPRMLVSRGELPWVYRQKVKKSMNSLSKIMASRPPQSVDTNGTFGYHYDH